MSNIITFSEESGQKPVPSKIITTVLYTEVFAHINSIPYAWLSNMDVTDAIFSQEQNISQEYPGLFDTPVLTYSITWSENDDQLEIYITWRLYQ